MKKFKVQIFNWCFSRIVDRKLEELGYPNKSLHEVTQKELGEIVTMFYMYNMDVMLTGVETIIIGVDVRGGKFRQR